VADGNVLRPPAVDCNGIVIRYGRTLAVDRLSFVAHAGQVVALLGPNGAGKTSTVEALEGYRRLDGGSARVLGLDPLRHHAELVGRIGVMLQRGGIYPMLGSAQVLHLFAAYYDDPEDPDQLIERVGLGPVRRTPWRRLSGGEQQRLSLALALVGKPEVLFLDEPTAGVDPEGRIVVRDIIADQRASGICVVLTTHELDEAERLADQVVIIDGGKKLAEGSPSDLASGTADGSIRFTTASGIDTDALCSALMGALGPGTTVTEERPGAYRLVTGAGVTPPTAIAALTGWLATHDLTVGDLRTGHSLEEAYLAITGSGRDALSDPTGADPLPLDRERDRDVDRKRESGRFPGGRRGARRGRNASTDHLDR
jgi:ABC-2 type transport system ATP-binding protein